MKNHSNAQNKIVIWGSIKWEIWGSTWISGTKI